MSEEAQTIQARTEELTSLGDLYCHKRKFLVQSEVTGGGYHVLIDYTRALTQPGDALSQIEVECQWKKVPPREPVADPMAIAVAEIEQLTQAICAVLPDLQPTQLTKRGWLKSSRAAFVC